MPKLLKILILMFILPVTAIPVYAQYSGGTGTGDDPYQLASLDDLKTLSRSPADWDKSFILTADIDASGTVNWNDGSGFSPIGEYGNPFSGSFDGQGHTISGLYISRKNSNEIGLFGLISAGEVKNLVLDGFQIEGSQRVGGLAGRIGEPGAEVSRINFVTCINCVIKGVAIVGGLTGKVSLSTINDCRFAGSVTGSISIIGGLAGKTDQGNGAGINNCHVSVLLKGPAYTGGLVGINRILINNCGVDVQTDMANSHYLGGVAGTNIGTIVNSYATGEISIPGNNNIDNDYIGGIVALNDGTVRNCYSGVNIVAGKSSFVGGVAGENGNLIKSCYAFGSVTAQKAVGGLAGITTDGSQNINCYSTATVTGGDKTGGLVGENSYFATITNCYASGEVISGAWFSGGLAGLNKSTAHTVNCFFDKETSGKENGIGMDQNGQNQEVTGLETVDFNDQAIFEEAGWQFGNTSGAPWKTGTAPDGWKRPVFYYHQYTVTFLSDTGGQLLPESHRVQTVTCGNNSDTIRAVPDDGWIFRKWQTLSGDSITNINPLVISNVTSDTTLVAEFLFTDDIKENVAGKIAVYPNPARESITLSYSLSPGNRKAEIEFRNASGHTVVTKTLKQQEGKVVFNTMDLPAGIYFYTLKTSQSFITGRFVIVK